MSSTTKPMENSSTSSSTGAPALSLKTNNDNNNREEEIEQMKKELEEAKVGEVKLYSVLKRVASELKETKESRNRLKGELEDCQRGRRMDITQSDTTASTTRAWYDGGMWRAPELLPGIQERKEGERVANALREPISLSDLFLDLVIVTSFTRVGVAVEDKGEVDGPIIAYFVVFWLIWGKDASFSTRFDTTDLSSQLANLLTCFAVLFGSLSSTAPFQSEDATRIMIVALFVAILHFGLHTRVWFWFKDAGPDSDLNAVKVYAEYVMLLTFLESVTWCIGIFILPEDSQHRWIIFFVGIIFSFRIPRTFLPNDFHAACSKRGVLFILLLGFLLQNVVLAATPFFDYQMPGTEQYFFLGLACFLLFCIKLLYVDDNFSMDPADHALLVNRTVGFLFHLGQLALLLSTTVLGAGLDLLTHSYLTATIALPANAKSLVCGGFSGVILSIGFIKSMHIRRFPLNPAHKRLFFAAYGTQLIVLFVVASTTISMSRDSLGAFRGVYFTEIQMLLILSFLALFLLIISWLDEAVEINLYGQVSDARQFRVHPFGLWTCFTPGTPDPPLKLPDNEADARMSHLSPLLSSSSTSLFGSKRNLYASLDQTENSGDSEPKGSNRQVSFSPNTKIKQDESGELA